MCAPAHCAPAIIAAVTIVIQNDFARVIISFSIVGGIINL